jgi:hypothetical protein
MREMPKKTIEVPISNGNGVIGGVS